MPGLHVPYQFNAAVKAAVFENSLPRGSVEFIPPGGGTALART